MKKIVSIFLSLCISAGIMCGCNSSVSSDVVSNPSSAVSETGEISQDEQSSEISEETSIVISSDGSSLISEISDNSAESSLNNSSSQVSSESSTITSSNSNTPSNTASNSQTSKPTSSNSTNNNQSNNNNTSNNQTSNSTNNTTSKPSTSSNTTQTSKPSTSSNTTQTSKPSTSSNPTQTSTPSTSTNTNTNNNGNTLSDAEQEELYQALFDINSKISIQIDISDSELKKLQQDYDKYKNKNSKSPIYRIATKVTFTVNGKKYEIEDVGVRLKGNTSRTDFYSSSEGMYNMTHLRLSFDETFDDSSYYGSDARKWNDADRKERKKRTFATLNGLEIKWNRNYDQTYIREYYTSQMYRENGILCARNNICQMNISGDNMGVYVIYEPIDKNFIERNLPEEDWGGDLYKVAWTNSPADYTHNVSYGIEDEDKSKFYNFDLKTNKSSSTHASLKNLLNVINKSNLTQSEFEKVVDKDYWVKFAAISYFVGNPDDLRNNYNNHYVYFLKSTGKAIFIPYDNDRTLGVTCGYNPTGNGMTEVSPFSTQAEGNRSSQRNPLYTKTILNNGFYVNQYKTELSKIANSKWLTMANFEKIYNIAKSHYSSCTKPSKDYKNVDESRLSFSLEGKYTSGEDYNIAIDDYFKRILKTYNKYV